MLSVPLHFITTSMDSPTTLLASPRFFGIFTPIITLLIGQFALGNNDSSGNGSANENTAVGSEALAVNINGSENTAVGSFALGNNQASGLTAIGADALSGNTDGIRNTAAGTAALLQNEHADDNTAVGWDALLTPI